MALAQDVSLGCRVLLGTVFLVSVISKLRSKSEWRSYRSWLMALPLRPLRWNGAPAVLVTAEVAVVLLVTSPLATIGLIVGSIFCLALAAGLAVALRRGAWQPCHCFGSSSEPLSGQHVIRNALLFALSVTGLVAATAGGQATPGAAEAGLAVIGGLAASVLIVFFGDLAPLLRASTALRSPATPAGLPSAPTAGTH